MKESSLESSFKIAILGGKRVGKSAITVRFLTRRYIGEYSSLKDHLYQETVVTSEGKKVIEILDICGDWIEKPDSVLKEVISWSHGLILVYDVSDRQSFHSIFKLMHVIKLIRSSFCPILLLGNKRDIEIGRRVDCIEGKKLASKFHAHFSEVSAAESCHGILTALDKLIHHLVNLRPSFLASSSIPLRTKSISICPESTKRSSPPDPSSSSVLLSSSYPSSSSSGFFFQSSFMMSLKKGRQSSISAASGSILSEQIESPSNSMKSSLSSSSSGTSNTCSPAASTAFPPSSSVGLNKRSASIDVPTKSLAHPAVIASNSYSVNFHASSMPVHKKSWTSQLNRIGSVLGSAGRKASLSNNSKLNI